MTMSEVFSNFSFWSLTFLAAGFFMLILEMFVPDFGIIGIIGIISLISFVVISATSFLHGLILGGILLLILFVFFVIFLWIGSKGKLPKKIVLFSEQEHKEGYVAADYEKFIGAAGVAASPLRPAGIMKVDDENLNVVSDGEFIEKGSKLRVKKVEGGRIVVGLDGMK